MPKVWMPMNAAMAASSNALQGFANCYNIWKGLGYDVDISHVDNDDTRLLSATPGCDIICHPYVNSDISIPNNTEINRSCFRGSGQVTTFVNNFNGAGTVNYIVNGVKDRVSSSEVTETLYWGAADSIITMLTRLQASWEGAEAGGYGVTTPIIADAYPMTEAAGARLAVWRFDSTTSANGSSTYVSETRFDSLLLIPMIQQAVLDGKIAPPPNKKLVNFDFDDFPAGANTAEEVIRVAAALRKHNFIGTPGVHGGYATQGGTGRDELQNHKDVFPVVIDHQVAGETYYFDWDSQDGSGPITRSAMNTRYLGAISDISAKDPSITVGNGGYRFFNQNAFDDNGLSLLTHITALSSDPKDTPVSPVAGYGIKLARCFYSVEGRVVLPLPSTTFKWNYGNTRFSRFTAPQQGVKFSHYSTISDVGCNTAVLDDASFKSTALPIWRSFQGQNFAAPIMSLAVHNVDVYDGHDGGTAGSPGTTQFERVVDFIAKCSDIYKVIDPRSVRKVNSIDRSRATGY